MATTLWASGAKPSAVIGKDRVRFIYSRRPADGQIRGQIRDSAENLLVADFQAYLGPVDNDFMPVQERVTAGGKRQLILQCVIAGAVTELYSFDGQTFT